MRCLLLISFGTRIVADEPGLGASWKTVHGPNAKEADRF
jgi:hypothetical protein